MRYFLILSDLEKVIHAFLYSQLDYYNSSYSGFSYKSNAAAWLLRNAGRQDLISSVLAPLHWLPVSSRTGFKIVMITF